MIISECHECSVGSYRVRHRVVVVVSKWVSVVRSSSI